MKSARKSSKAGPAKSPELIASYKSAKAQALAELTQLQARLEKLVTQYDQDDIHYGHVGTLNLIKAQCSEIAR